MKKIIFCTAIVCLLTAGVYCKSKAEKKAKGKKAAVETPVETVENTAEESDSSKVITGLSKKEQKKLAKQQEKEAKKLAKAQKSGKKAAEKDPKSAAGWIQSTKKNIHERFGNVQLKVKPGIGSYTLAAVNEKDKAVPVLSTANEFITNAFFLKTSKKTYNLITDGNVRASGNATTDGATIMYDVPSVAQVSVNFSCFSSDKKKEADMIKVKIGVKNTSERADEFSIKAIFDTVLGEAATYHFYTWEGIPVKSEVLYRTLQNQKWFLCKNMNAEMQLFFSGADCTVPELVALANYTTLEKNSWEPDMLSYRVFDTVLSYNNSAVCSIWKPIKLAPTETGKVVFYIAMNGNGTPATGEKFIYSKEFEKKPEEEKSAGAKVNSASALEVITPYSSEGANEEKPFVEEIKEPEPVKEVSDLNPSQEAKNDEIPNVDFYIQNMSKEQLSPEYIQNLLDRIAALEEDSSSLNRQELLQLNAELDAILTYLRQ